MHVCMYIDVTIQFVTKQSICTEAGVWIEQQQQQHFIHISITGFVKLIE